MENSCLVIFPTTIRTVSEDTLGYHEKKKAELIHLCNAC